MLCEGRRRDVIPKQDKIVKKNTKISKIILEIMKKLFDAY